jgi:hypothetical protein
VSTHVGDRLAAYLDGELSPRERAEIDTHLGGCAACGRRLEELSSVDAAVRALPAEAPAGYFDTFPGRVRARLEPRPRRAVWRIPVWYAAAAAALIVAVIAPVVWKRSERLSAPASQDAIMPAPRPATGRAASPSPPSTAAPSADQGALRAYQHRRGEQGLAKRAPAPPSPEGGVLGARPEAPSLEESAPDEAVSGFAERPRAAVAPAAPPAPSPAAPPRAADERVGRASVAERSSTAETEESRERRRDKKALEAAAPPPAEAEAFTLAGEEMSYRELLARTARTREEARALREAWRAYLRRYPRGAGADEARVRMVEAGYTAYQLGRDPEDLARFNEDSTEYLQQRDATQSERVRQLQRAVER